MYACPHLFFPLVDESPLPRQQNPPQAGGFSITFAQGFQPVADAAAASALTPCATDCRFFVVPSLSSNSLPQKSDGSANINELFALYNEWKKKGGESKAESSDDSSKQKKQNDKDDKPEVVELDENSELARRVDGVTGKARAKVIANYIIEALGGRTITLHDGIYADVDNGDLTKMARDAFSHGKGLRRTAELGEITKLIDNARYSRSDDDAKHNKFSAFRYYSVKTRYKGEEESLLLNIGKNKFTGKYNFYTITVDDDE